MPLAGSGNLGSSVALGANMENQRYQNQQALPTDGGDKAKMFSEIAKDFKGSDGGLLSSAASGIAEGFADGARSRDTKQKRDNFDKYDNVMNYFQKANNAAVERNQWYEEKEMEAEKIRPFATAGLEISYSGMDYQKGNEAMRNVMEQAKLSNPNIKGDYVGYVPNSPIVNMRDENGNITALSLSAIVGEDATKRVQGNYIDQQKINIEREVAPMKYAAMEARTEAAIQRTKQMAQRTYEKAKEKYAPKIEASAKVQVIASKMEKLIKENPGVFLDVYNAVWDSNEEEPSALRLLMQRFTNGKTAEAIKELGKNIYELKIGSIKGLSNPNRFADMVVAGTIPGRGMPDASVLKILKDIDEKAKYEMELNKEYLNDIQGAYDQEFGGGDKYSQMAGNYIEKQTGNSPQNTPPTNANDPRAQRWKQSQ